MNTDSNRWIRTDDRFYSLSSSEGGFSAQVVDIASDCPGLPAEAPLEKSISAVPEPYRGRKKHPLYNVWLGMVQRCHSPRNPNYPYYGGRGICVCAEWMSFNAFAEAVGPRPTPRHTLDRVDNGGHYEPGNVRWATRYEQAQNRRTTVRYPLEGELLTPSEIRRRFASTVPLTTLTSRLAAGWPAAQAATQPVDRRYNPKLTQAERDCAPRPRSPSPVRLPGDATGGAS